MMESINRKKVLYLYNPASGKGKIEKNLAYIIKEFNRKFGSIEVIRSESKEHFQKTVEYACRERYDYLFFSGGDGTFNMVVNSIPDMDILPIFGYLPGGSTCDMSYNVNISKKPRKGIHDLLNATPKKYNMGQIGDRKFIYVADCGDLNNTAHITPADAKRKWGNLAYAYYGLKTFFKHFHLHKFIVDGVIYETPLIIISNSKEVGSFKINPTTEQGNGEYYLIIVKKGPIKGAFNIAHLFAFGVESAIKNNKVYCFRSSIFKIDSDTNTWDVDGELAEIEFPVSCGFSGRSINVLTNR